MVQSSYLIDEVKLEKVKVLLEREFGVKNKMSYLLNYLLDIWIEKKIEGLTEEERQWFEWKFRPRGKSEIQVFSI